MSSSVDVAVRFARRNAKRTGGGDGSVGFRDRRSPWSTACVSAGLTAPRTQEAAHSFDNQGRKEGIHQFIYKKSNKPGLGAYDKSQGRE